MTPEELDKLEAIVKAMTPGDWYVDSSRRGIETQTDVGAVEVAAWMSRADVTGVVALHNAAPTLIAAARDMHTLQVGVGHPMWLPSVADALGMDEPFAATSSDVLDRVRALAREVERLRAQVEADCSLRQIAANIADMPTSDDPPPWDAICEAHIAPMRAEIERLRAFVPVWRMKRYSPAVVTWRLFIGNTVIPDTGVHVSDDGLVFASGDCEGYPDLPTAAAAVCARLRIPSVEVGDV